MANLREENLHRPSASRRSSSSMVPVAIRAGGELACASKKERGVWSVKLGAVDWRGEEGDEGGEQGMVRAPLNNTNKSVWTSRCPRVSTVGDGVDVSEK